ncbi:MAG: hypothetical protein N3G20_01230 [Verrucomicrobiae bacterium]|nr:hypothetical protein [Verrucomicrobiae bacterium]
MKGACCMVKAKEEPESVDSDNLINLRPVMLQVFFKARSEFQTGQSLVASDNFGFAHW